MPEFHDLAEVALNKTGESWGNLGYWRDRKDYSGACRALAMVLGDALGLDRDSTVMDAGFGCGDQLLLWRQHYNVADLRGVNYSRSQTSLAKQKLIENGYSEDCGNLRHGDASIPEHWDFPKRPTTNRVVALDCAYHFSSRSRFLRLAGQHLEPGGRIGLTDIMLSNRPKLRFPERCILAIMLRLSRIPRVNIVTDSGYSHEMETAGFEQIEIKDISPDVMPSFANWWRMYRHTTDARDIPVSSRLKYGATARFLDWAHRNNILRYGLITAIRSRPAR